MTERQKDCILEIQELIVAINDVVKKYADILLFIQKYCREYEITNNKESEFWYYCIETDIPLLPTFYYDLAESFANNTYNEAVNKIVKERGVESNDGDIEALFVTLKKFIN